MMLDACTLASCFGGRLGWCHGLLTSHTIITFLVDQAVFPCQIFITNIGFLQNILLVDLGQKTVHMDWKRWWIS